jgi:hypothetical protein
MDFVKARAAIVGVIVGCVVLLAAASAGAAFDPTGTWKSVYHCKAGWCAGQDFPADMVVARYDAKSGVYSGTYANSPMTGKIDGQKFTIDEGDPNGYHSTGTGTISADGNTWTGDGHDSNDTSGSFEIKRAGAAPAAGAGNSTAPAVPAAANRSTLLDIPSPSNALTAKNVAEAFGLTLLLLMLVAFPSTLFNSTLEKNLDEIRRWFPWTRHHKAPSATATSFWHTGRGFAVYLAAAAVLYSRMQPGWGWNGPTLQSLLGFAAGIAATTLAGVGVTRAYLHRRYGADGGGHLDIEFGTLVFALVCVVASRIANFQPGYFYGVLAAYVTTRELTREDGGRISLRSVGLTYGLACGAWLLLGPLGHLGNGGGAQLLQSVVGGLVTGGVEAIVIGLTPLRFLPGHELKKWNPKVWLGAWAGGAFLFCLVLLHPGLVGAHEASVTATLVLAGAFAAGSFAFWAYFRHRDEQREHAAASAEVRVE